MNRSILLLLIQLLSFSMIKGQDNLVTNYNFQNTTPHVELKSSIDSTQHDKKRVQTHGVFGDFLGRSLNYLVGYEYFIAINKNAFGVGLGGSYFYKKTVGVGHANISLGVGIYHEYGLNWGIRSGLYYGFNFNPAMYQGKFETMHIARANQPYYSLQGLAIQTGPYYKTKNKRWQFLLNAFLYITRQKNIGTVGEDYKFTSSLLPFIGITVKYNFKIH